MIRDFNSWAARAGIEELDGLESLSGVRVGIDAAHYINARVLQYNDTAKEPLLSAIGGLPLILKHQVETDLSKWQQYNILPFFVFSGLAVGKEEDPFRHKMEQSQVNAMAWGLYNQHEADKAVTTFAESTYVTPEELFRALQNILYQHNLPFQVAPYRACAQLAYLVDPTREFVSAVAGSSELFLFGCDKIISSWDLPPGEFRFITRQKCIEAIKADMKRLGNGDITENMFVDACLLAGSPILPTFPILETARGKNMPSASLPKPVAAMEMILTHGRSAQSVILHYQDDPRLRSVNYKEKFATAQAVIRHHLLLTAEGKVDSLDFASRPNNMHEIIGPRLPDELYWYLNKGFIGSRVLNWRVSNEIIEVQPLDGGDSDEYRTLVREKLTPLRVSAIALLSQALHRFWQHKDLTLKCWFTDARSQHYTSNISMRDVPDVRSAVSKWNVKDSAVKEAISKSPGDGLIGPAVLSLRDSDFASKSLVKKDENNMLRTEDEILFNAVWRFLTLRDYVDINHKLTPWGEVLATTMAALNGNTQLEEPAIIAIELLRLDLLNTRNMFAYTGAPMRGTDFDRRNNLLVSRIACLGTLRHKPIGFTGPLSQHLLAYHSMITAVRNTLRDLAEVSLTHMCLNGEVQRSFEDPSPLGMKLPFLLPNDCALGIAVKSYLDELTVHEDPTSQEAKDAVLETASKRYFPQCVGLPTDLNVAFSLWDAVYAGVKASGNLVKERKVWDEVDEWLAGRR
jgi:hypothetical protein